MTDPQYTTRSEAEEELLRSLNQWKADGVKDPMICSYTDANSDGRPDIWGLDAFGNLELRPDATVSDTVSVSDGSGFENPKVD